MPIDLGSCTAWDTIVVKTRASVYVLVVLRGDAGNVLMRGGSHFREFRRLLFAGSIADDGSLHPRTIDIGLHMQFIVKIGSSPPHGSNHSHGVAS